VNIYKNLFSNGFCNTIVEKIKNECVLSESHKINWFIWLVWGQQPSQRLVKEKWNDELYTLLSDELFKGDFEKRKITWIQMTEYKDNRWLRRHIDGGNNKTLIILLSDGFIGGDTYINDKPVKLEKGDGVLFNGHSQFHEVKPVTEGTRYALNFWFS
jgi:hypothetical protein